MDVMAEGSRVIGGIKADCNASRRTDTAADDDAVDRRKFTPQENWYREHDHRGNARGDRTPER